MKNNLKLKLIGVTICIALFACKNIESITASPNGDNELTKDTVASIKVDQYMSNTAGKYILNYVPTDFHAGVSSLRSTPIDPKVVATFDGLYEDCQTKTKSNLVSPFVIFADDILLDRTMMSEKTKAESVDKSELYGKTVKFKFATQGATKTSQPDTVVEMYIPEFVNITSPAIQTERDLYPLCVVKDFILRWNADSNNKNGLIVSVEWLGTVLYGEDVKDTYVRRTDFIANDNGEAKLNERMFDDIPDAALAYITLMRGNVENIIVSDYSYKLSGESHVVLPFIVIRNTKRR